MQVKKNEFKKALFNMGLTKRALAGITGLSPQAISNWSSGRYGISPSAAKKVADALGKKIDELFIY